MQTDRAKLQRQITSLAYASFVAALVGNYQGEVLAIADYGAMEMLARHAIRERMGMGWTEVYHYLPAQTAVRQHLWLCYPQMQSIYLNYADDEITTLVQEELGLLSPTLH